MVKKETKKILENFLQEMEGSNKSHYTIINYRSDILSFLENCCLNNMENLTVESLRKHLDGLDTKSPTTKSRHISSLKTFLNWCYRKDYIKNNPIYKIDNKIPKVQTVSKAVNKNLIEKVICSINIRNSNNLINLNNLKYRILFTLMLEGGLKVYEALNLRLENIEIETETILVNSENKRRIPLCSSESIKLIKLYINEANIKSGLIFKGGEKQEKSLSYQAVNRFWRKCCLKFDTDIKLQQLRDYYAQDLVRKGFNISTISKLLGHRNIQNTAKYLIN